MLTLLDLFFHILHLAVIGFNLFGWVSPHTRRLHCWCVGMTAFCWLAVGLWVGRIGYCPLTAWHWDIKRMTGENDLPGSYITYLLNRAGFNPAALPVDIAVGIIFAVIVVLTLMLWFQERKAASGN